MRFAVELAYPPDSTNHMVSLRWAQNETGNDGKSHQLVSGRVVSSSSGLVYGVGGDGDWFFAGFVPRPLHPSPFASVAGRSNRRRTFSAAVDPPAFTRSLNALETS